MHTLITFNASALLHEVGVGELLQNIAILFHDFRGLEKTVEF